MSKYKISIIDHAKCVLDLKPIEIIHAYAFIDLQVTSIKLFQTWKIFALVNIV